MRSYDRDEMNNAFQWRVSFKKFKRGICAFKDRPVKILIPAGITAAYFILILYLKVKMYSTPNILHRLTNALEIMLLIITFLPVIYFTICAIGSGIKGLFVDPQMHRTTVRNSIGETPSMVSHRKGDDGKTEVYDFIGEGIPLSDYEDRVAEIESALNMNVVRIEQGHSKNHVIVTGVGYDHSLPKMLIWDDQYISDKDFELVIGENLLGTEKVDLNKLPHILIGGSTGSGKSVCLKNLIYQSVKKDAQVYVADFKGGVDYSGKWRSFVNVVTDIDSLIALLDRILAELAVRKTQLYCSTYVNIAEYNRNSGIKMKRIIIACDEVAELLDKTGLDKENKEKVTRVESALSTIARQGRAFGINLILATQRPDANILPGQIRNNIDYRICGRADDVLSKIVLDNTDASEKIPKYEQGLFLSNTGTLIRAFYFNESMIKG